MPSGVLVQVQSRAPIQNYKMMKINTQLEDLAIGNEEYAKFNKKIVNTKKTVLGVRVPDLRKLAKKLARNIDHNEIENLLLQIDKNIYEQVLLCGLVISQAKLTDAQRINLTKKYLQLVDSWAEIDTFAPKRTLQNRQIWWDFITNCLKSDQEFVVRYGVIELMQNFLDQSSIKQVLAKIRTVKHRGYYVKMAIAWLYATAAVDFFDLVMNEIKTNQIDNWTKQKALQKMLESYRISDQQKELIREIKFQLKQE